eukprot:m.211976 g.211976  ORF g.211976 m.211976 type:complete len:456 (-) comp13786_c0_seq1:3538-4905(-)
MQLLSLQGRSNRSDRPFLGVVTDGYRWAFIILTANCFWIEGPKVYTTRTWDELFDMGGVLTSLLREVSSGSSPLNNSTSVTSADNAANELPKPSKDNTARSRSNSCNKHNNNNNEKDNVKEGKSKSSPTPLTSPKEEQSPKPVRSQSYCFQLKKAPLSPEKIQNSKLRRRCVSLPVQSSSTATQPSSASFLSHSKTTAIAQQPQPNPTDNRSLQTDSPPCDRQKDEEHPDQPYQQRSDHQIEEKVDASMKGDTTPIPQLIRRQRHRSNATAPSSSTSRWLSSLNRSWSVDEDQRQRKKAKLMTGTSPSPSSSFSSTFSSSSLCGRGCWMLCFSSSGQGSDVIQSITRAMENGRLPDCNVRVRTVQEMLVSLTSKPSQAFMDFLSRAEQYTQEHHDGGDDGVSAGNTFCLTVYCDLSNNETIGDTVETIAENNNHNLIPMALLKRKTVLRTRHCAL